MSWRSPEDNDDGDDPRKPPRWFKGFFSDDMFHEIEALMERMMKNMFSEGMIDSDNLERMFKSSASSSPFVFGFSVKTGPDGRPIIQRFGNTMPDDEMGPLRPQIEPLTDVFEEDEEIIAVAELPGVESNEIKVRVKGQHLIIDVDNPQRPYHKELELPAKVRKDEAKSSIRNGVLEVRLKKA